jgi:DNA-binding transcriptional ArsR family regulator
MSDPPLFLIASSPTRLKLIQLLGERPRTLVELAQGVSVTTQAALKHLGALERDGLLEKVRLGERGHPGPRYVYRLRVIVDAAREEGVLGWMHLMVKRPEEGGPVPSSLADSPKRVVELLQRLKLEASVWRRRLRLVRDRERRLFLELANVEESRRGLVRSGGFGPLDEILVSAYLEGADVEGLRGLCRDLKVDEGQADRFLRRIR